MALRALVVFCAVAGFALETRPCASEFAGAQANTMEVKKARAATFVEVALMVLLVELVDSVFEIVRRRSLVT